MIIRRLTGAGAALLLLLVPSLLSPEPKSPAEPKAPEIRDAVDDKGRDSGKMPPGGKTSFEYPAVISYANGGRHKAVLVLPRQKIAAAYSQNGRRHLLDEEISGILSVEFRGWEQSKKKGFFYHSLAAVTLGDKSVYMCGNVDLFNRFVIRRGKETYAGYTYFYHEQPRQVKAAKRKGGAAKKTKQPEPVAGQAPPPHPDTVVGIRFIREEGSKGLEDIIPLLLK